MPMMMEWPFMVIENAHTFVRCFWYKESCGFPATAKINHVRPSIMSKSERRRRGKREEKKGRERK